MRPNSCVGCRSHYREQHWRVFMIDFCGLDGDVVGFECQLGVVDPRRCPKYTVGYKIKPGIEPEIETQMFEWPGGAIP